jgi:nicotinate-nucleotide adenylyltransferase
VTAAWGILGGTFDPVHHGHLAVAERTREELGLAGVLWVPAGLPPHKGEELVTPVSHRAAMVELAIADNPLFRLSRVEMDRPGPSYTVDTLERLRADGLGGDEGLVLILSAEALARFTGWREPDRILDLARLAVVPRGGHRPVRRAWLAEHFPGREDRVTFLDGPTLLDSATDIRRLAAAGRSIRYLTPDAVVRYIEDHRLYPPREWSRS